MIKAVTLYVFLVIAGQPPTMHSIPMPDLGECISQGTNYMMSESKELTEANVPYKQAFLCEEAYVPLVRG